ncbi:unnamed protein product [Mycena citricolor]|uniref:Urease accessory protein UreF n=1 Tax=Mycena citricolor TaxID=2018698 RepID=A0AAD2GSH3_9AGAR|nr:unnamed protein product [Mycena citricolor]
MVAFDETYLLLLLSDSNLPTGSFVASSGLESFLTHGFGTPLSTSRNLAGQKMDTIAVFIRDSLSTYAPSALPFVSDAHSVVSDLCNSGQSVDATLGLMNQLEALYESMMLNDVARRASKSQGVALLSLYSKGFSRPSGMSVTRSEPEKESGDISVLVDRFKLMVRRGDPDAHGHLSTCWGLLCAALGLSLDRAQHLHLYLHARSLLSAAVRLNSIGPYAAQQIILYSVESIVDQELQRCAHLRTGIMPREREDSTWDAALSGPASTWPLGEILAARHDLQHSRIFNS